MQKVSINLRADSFQLSTNFFAVNEDFSAKLILFIDSRLFSTIADVE